MAFNYNLSLMNKCEYLSKNYVCENNSEDTIKDILSLIINSKIIIRTNHKRIIIDPIFIEAYVARDTEDTCTTNNPCHGNYMQLNRYLKLYYHRKGRGGVDLVLAKSNNVYFSILLKCCKINGEVCSQIQVANKLKRLFINENSDCSLTFKTNSITNYCKRINVNGNNYEFAAYINNECIRKNNLSPNYIYKKLRENNI